MRLMYDYWYLMSSDKGNYYPVKKLEIHGNQAPSQDKTVFLKFVPYA